jgi:hypothetical protein
MITNKDAIYQIKDLFHKDQISSDNTESDRWIFREILKYRSSLISQKFKQKDFLNTLLYQEICVKLVETNKNECLCNVPDDCSVYVSDILLPKSIIPYDFVSNTDNSVQYSKIDTKTARFKTNTRYTYLNNKSAFYTLDQGLGDHLYIVSKNPLLTNAKVKTIFENPLEAQMYPDCEGVIPFPCRSAYDYEFKTDQALFTTIKQLIIRDYGNLIMQGPLDNVHDNRNNPTE